MHICPVFMIITVISCGRFRRMKSVMRHFDLSSIPLFLNIAATSVRKQLGQIEWWTKYCSKTMRRRETLKQFIRPFCKLGKWITYLKFRRSYQCSTRFVRPWWLVIFWYLYAYFSFWDAKLCQEGSPGRMF